MANTIKIKRRPASGAAGKPSSLLNGELAFNENDNILYYGYGSGVAGVASSIEQIGGTGYLATRGGTNASGLWPISVTGNSATVTNGVYTTGDQTIAGRKTFSTYPIISGNLGGELVFQSAINTNGGNIIFDGVNLGSETSYIKSSTAQMNIAHGSKIQLDSTLEVIAENTSGNSVGYFAVFDTNPASSLTTLKSVSKDQILDDIGAATSGLTITAGSGLIGGGNLSTNRTFDINTGDGIQIVSDAVAVDSTVVRTTGTQTINGSKTFGNQTTFTSGIITPSVLSTGDLYLYGVDVINLDISNGSESAGIGCIYNASENQQFQCYDTNSDNVILSVGDRLSILSPNTAVSGTYFPVFTQNPNAGTSAILSRTASQLKGDIGLSNVTNDAQIKKLASTSGGFVPTWNGTTGDALNVGYNVETVLTGGAGALPRADAVKTYVDNMIVSGIATNDAMIFKGAIDCSTNPNYPAADRGWTYKVSVAGKIGGASGPVVEVNDTLICGTDSTPSGIHSVVGGNWNILQTNIVDASILVTGPTSATSGNIALFDGTTGKIIKDGGFLASNVVLTTGNQSISGDKTFNNTIYAKSKLTVGIDSGSSYTTGEVFKIAHTDSADLVTINNGTTLAGSYIYLNAITQFNTPSFGSTPLIINPTGYLSTGAITQGYWRGSTIEVDKGGTGQTSYTNGQLLIGNTTGNTLSKATLTEGTGIDITNGNGSITITHEDTSTLTGAQGSNGIASFTLDGMGHVTAVTTATYLTAGTVCAAIVDCSLDGGSF